MTSSHPRRHAGSGFRGDVTERLSRNLVTQQGVILVNGDFIGVKVGGGVLDVLRGSVWRHHVTGPAEHGSGAGTPPVVMVMRIVARSDDVRPRVVQVFGY